MPSRYSNSNDIYDAVHTVCSVMRRVEMQALGLCLLRSRRYKPGSRSQQQIQQNRLFGKRRTFHSFSRILGGCPNSTRGFRVSRSLEQVNTIKNS